MPGTSIPARPYLFRIDMQPDGPRQTIHRSESGFFPTSQMADSIRIAFTGIGTDGRPVLHFNHRGSAPPGFGPAFRAEPGQRNFFIAVVTDGPCEFQPGRPGPWYPRTPTELDPVPLHYGQAVRYRGFTAHWSAVTEDNRPVITLERTP